MHSLTEGTLLKQISSLNEQLVEQNNKITKALLQVMHSRQSHPPPSPSSYNLLQHLSSQAKQLQNYSRLSSKSNKSDKRKSKPGDKKNSIGRLQKRCSSCERTRDSLSRSMKQADKSRLLAMGGYASPQGRNVNGCVKESNIVKLKKLSMKLYPKVSNQFLFKNRSRAMNLGV